MTGRMGGQQAAARVHAALGRPPQDALEASVALEAWGGLVPDSALAVAAGTLRHHHPAGGVSTRRLADKPDDGGTAVREVVGLVVTLLATAAWVGPLTSALGQDAVATAWKVALPVTLALQWLMRRRYLTGAPAGLLRLRRDRPALVVGSVLLAALPVSVEVDPATAVAGVLLLTWVAGMLLAVRGWGIGYAVWLLAATTALHAGLPVVPGLVVIAVVTGTALAVAVGTSQGGAASPAPWGLSAAAGVCGGSIAVLIVTDPTVAWAGPGPFPVLALAPSLLGGVWASRHLNRVWTVLVAALSGTGVLSAAATPSRVFGGLVVGALGRLLVGTALLSWAAFLVLDDGSVSQASVVRLLVGLGAFGLISFVVALLESFLRVVAALAVAAASVAAAGFALLGPAPVAAWSLPAGAVVAVLVAAPWLVALVRRPARTLATLL